MGVAYYHENDYTMTESPACGYTYTVSFEGTHDFADFYLVTTTTPHSTALYMYTSDLNNQNI